MGTKQHIACWLGNASAPTRPVKIQTLSKWRTACKRFGKRSVLTDGGPCESSAAFRKYFGLFGCIPNGFFFLCWQKTVLYSLIRCVKCYRAPPYACESRSCRVLCRALLFPLFLSVLCPGPVHRVFVQRVSLRERKKEKSSHPLRSTVRVRHDQFATTF